MVSHTAVVSSTLKRTDILPFCPFNLAFVTENTRFSLDEHPDNQRIRSNLPLWNAIHSGRIQKNVSNKYITSGFWKIQTFPELILRALFQWRRPFMFGKFFFFFLKFRFFRTLRDTRSRLRNTWSTFVERISIVVFGSRNNEVIISARNTYLWTRVSVNILYTVSVLDGIKERKYREVALIIYKKKK